MDIYASCWVSGVHIRRTFDVIAAEVFVLDADWRAGDHLWDKAQQELERLMCEQAELMGANCIVGYEPALDLDAVNAAGESGVRFMAKGTPVVGVPMVEYGSASHD